MTMISLDTISLDQCRRFYAEEIRATAPLESVALVNAFARVPRERFLGPPPWHLCSGPSIHPPVYRATSQVRDLYHDVFVALKPEKQLNNGQPSLVARMIAALNLSPGKRVAHIGCGSGYYSAIMADVVGPQGSVTALEVDSDLAAQAMANLIDEEQVTVLHKDGAEFYAPPADAILVNAGVTHPHPSWLHSLQPGGTLVLPLCVGKSPESRDALVIKITRMGGNFAASLLSLMTIYSSPSLHDADRQSQLNQCLESRSIVRLKSIQCNDHPQTESCILHAPGFCLSSRDSEQSMNAPPDSRL